MLLARTTEREREISVRFSLGACRACIIAQLVCTLGCAVCATLLCGLVPAIRGTHRSIASELADAGRTQVSSRNPLLVGVQVALAVTLLVGAGVLLRSFEEFGRVSPGFEISHVLTLRISGNWGETGEMKKLTGRINRTLDELSISPGVRAAATSATLPGIPDDYRMEVKLAEGRVDSQCEIVADTRFVSNGYFRGIQIPLEAGQRCRESLNYFDGVVVNGSFEPARAVFHISPLEQHLSHSFAENRLRTIPLSLCALTAVSPGCIGL